MDKVTLDELRQITLNSKDKIWELAKSLGRDVKIYDHWSAGHYGQFFDDYHINIDQDQSIYVSTKDLSTVLAHTYMRNTGSIGVALACCAGATTNDLGTEPPTAGQIETMSQVNAVLCKTLDLTCDLPHVMTHGEAANNLDGYNPGYTDPTGHPNNCYGPPTNPDGSEGGDCERWDLLFLKNGDPFWSGGNTIRGKANFYINQN